MTSGSGAFAQDRCGLGNGKRASGEPIQVGAIVGKTRPEDFSSSARAAEAYFKCVNKETSPDRRNFAAWRGESAAEGKS